MTDRELIRLAAKTLEPHLFVVWLQKHYQGVGRHTGSKFLGITQDAWRYRLDKAERTITTAIAARKDTAA